MIQQGKAYLEQLVADPNFQGLWMLQIKNVAAAFRAEALPSPISEEPLQIVNDSTLARQSGQAKREEDEDAWMFEDPPEKEYAT